MHGDFKSVTRFFSRNRKSEPLAFDTRDEPAASAACNVLQHMPHSKPSTTRVFNVHCYAVYSKPDQIALCEFESTGLASAGLAMPALDMAIMASRAFSA